MADFGTRITRFVNDKLEQARAFRRAGDARQEFTCFEDAHVLGQASTYWHARVHFEMLIWGVRNGSPREVLGQVLRLVGALTKTAIGWLPEGNTGGSNVSPFKPLPVRDDLQALIQRARADSSR